MACLAKPEPEAGCIKAFVSLSLIIDTRSLLLVVGLLSIADPSCPSVSHWNYLSDPVFDGVGLAGFKSRVNAFLLA